MFVTRWWHEMVGQPGGTAGIDDAFLRIYAPGVGAEIMGAGKYGYPGWHEDPEWKGAWGPNPPFHTPVFVLTHHTRPAIEMEGGTTFTRASSSLPPGGGGSGWGGRVRKQTCPRRRPRLVAGAGWRERAAQAPPSEAPGSP